MITFHVLSPFNSFSSDVITIDKTNENFRLIYDVKGRYSIHRITAEEAKVCHFEYWKDIFSKLKFIASFQYKLCKVKKCCMGAKGIPFLVTHDGRTIRYPDPHVKANDSIVFDIATNKITDFIKFDTGAFQLSTAIFDSKRTNWWNSRQLVHGDRRSQRWSRGHRGAPRTPPGLVRYRPCQGLGWQQLCHQASVSSTI